MEHGYSVSMQGTYLATQTHIPGRTSGSICSTWIASTAGHRSDSRESLKIERYVTSNEDFNVARRVRTDSLVVKSDKMNYQAEIELQAFLANTTVEWSKVGFDSIISFYLESYLEWREDVWQTSWKGTDERGIGKAVDIVVDTPASERSIGKRSCRGNYTTHASTAVCFLCSTEWPCDQGQPAILRWQCCVYMCVLVVFFIMCFFYGKHTCAHWSYFGNENSALVSIIKNVMPISCSAQMLVSPFTIKFLFFFNRQSISVCFQKRNETYLLKSLKSLQRLLSSNFFSLKEKMFHN